jgi:hypothetical protein
MMLLGMLLHKRPEASAMNKKEETASKQHVVVETDCHLVVVVVPAVGE